MKLEDTIKIVRNGQGFTVGPGGDFAEHEIKELALAASRQGATLPLSRKMVRAILLVKRILGGQVVG